MVCSFRCTSQIDACFAVAMCVILNHYYVLPAKYPKSNLTLFVLNGPLGFEAYQHKVGLASWDYTVCEVFLIHLVTLWFVYIKLLGIYHIHKCTCFVILIKRLCILIRDWRWVPGKDEPPQPGHFSYGLEGGEKYKEQKILVWSHV